MINKQYFYLLLPSLLLSFTMLAFTQTLNASNPLEDKLKEVEDALDKNLLSNKQDSIDYADSYFKKVYYTTQHDVPKSLEYAEELYAFAEITNLTDVQMINYHLKARIGKITNSPDVLDHYRTAEKYALESTWEGTKDYLMMIHNEMATYLGYQGKFNEAEKILKKSLAHYQEENNFNFISTICNRLGVLYAQQGKYEDALHYFKGAIEAEGKKEETDNIVNLYSNCGRILLLLGRPKEAIDYILKGIGKAEKFGRNDRKASGLIYVTEIMIGLEDYEEALKYGNQALSIADEIGDENLRNDALGNIGVIKYEQGKYQEAIDILRKVYDYTDSDNNKYMLVTRGIALANALYQTGKVDEAEKFLRQSLDSAIEGEFKKEIAQTKSELGFMYMEQGRKKEAFPLLKTAYEEVKKDSLKNRLMVDISKNLSILYAEKGNYKTAYKLNLESEAILDTLNSNENIREITKMEKDFQFNQERKETEFQRQIEMAEQKTIRIGLIIGLSALGLLTFFIFRNNRNKTKANKLLTEKNEQISEQNKQISKQKETLEKSNYTKDRIFAILGHDLRKPAIAFRGIARKVNFLLKKEDYQRIQELGEYIEDNALGLVTLTDNLLKWALSQKDALNINPEELELNKIIQETQLVLGRMADAKNIHIKSQIPKGTKIWADKNSVLTIVRNLIDNAIKYTPDNGTISIISTDSKVGLDLTIKDTGVGIPESKISSIFLLQERKSIQGTSGEKGTGLGLYLVHELVGLNKGDIKVSSRVGEGTSFVITLPKVA